MCKVAPAGTAPLVRLPVAACCFGGFRIVKKIQIFKNSTFKPNYYIDYLDDSPWIHMPYEKYETMKPEEIV